MNRRNFLTAAGGAVAISSLLEKPRIFKGSATSRYGIRQSKETRCQNCNHKDKKGCSTSDRPVCELKLGHLP